MWQSTHWLPGWPGVWRWCAGASKALGQMALAADRVALGAQLQAVRLVAVGAGHPGRVHPALQERAVVEDLAVDLAVGVVEARVEQRGPVAVEQRLADRVPVAERRAAGMAGRADLRLGAGRQRRHALGDARALRELPLALAAIVQQHGRGPWLGRRRRHRRSPRRRGRSPGRGRPRTTRSAPTRSYGSCRSSGHSRAADWSSGSRRTSSSSSD